MASASVETTLEFWASSLRDVKARMRPLFTRERVARSAGQFLDGLLGNEPRKTDEFAGALERSRASDKPSIIHCLIDPEAITPARSLTAIRKAALNT